MIAFYTWPRAACSLITVLFAVCALSQTLTAALSFYRRPRSRRWAFEVVLELFALVQVFICSMMHGQATQGYSLGMIPATGYGAPRLAVFFAILLCSAAIIAMTKKPWALAAAAASALALPAIEAHLEVAFPFLFTSAILFWLARSVFASILRIREIRTNLSALSVKNAIDSLHTGVMFCEKDGFTLLSNTRMQQLVKAVAGKVLRNGRQFYATLMLGEIDPLCKRTYYEGQTVILLPDSSAWLFTMTQLSIKKKQYDLLTAADVSERWALTAELQQKNEELKLRQKELSETVSNLQIISREKEIQAAKLRAHDILGERLTILMRTISTEEPIDPGLMRFLSQGIMEELKSEHVAPAPRDELEILKATFNAIGVEAVFTGDLPGDRAKGHIVADIAREAVTNAVRHGFASKVFFHMREEGGDFRMKITDNGRPLHGAVKEGDGICGMREKLKPFGGALYVAVSPRFELTVSLPGGDGSV